MPTTTNIGLSVPAHASNVDSWDTDPINDNSGKLDTIFGSVTTKSLSVSNVTLTAAESRVNILRFTGSLGTSVQITLGAVIKSWICENNCTGLQNFYVRVVGSTGTGNNVAIPPGTSQIYWDGTNIGFISLPVPMGGYWDYAGSAVPPWVTACTVPPYLHCNGATYNTLTYPQLFDIIGTVTLPDTRGRARIALDGGTGRVTTAGSGVDGASRFAAGGAQSVTLDATQMPAHDHTGNTGTESATHTHNVNDAVTKTGQFSTSGSNGWAANTVVASSTESATHTHAIQLAGGGLAHTNMQPSYVGGIVMIRAA